MWTLSGSCPLCLTPPCYQLRAAGNGGSFFCPNLGQITRDIPVSVNQRGNYIATLTISQSGQGLAAHAMLTQSYTEQMWLREWECVASCEKKVTAKRNLYSSVSASRARKLSQNYSVTAWRWLKKRRPTSTA